MKSWLGAITDDSELSILNYKLKYMKPLWEEDEDVLVEDDIDDGSGIGDDAQLIVFNDEVNSFDWVIECFMAVLRHPHDQAEQLSIIIHYKGKATVKTASRDKLEPLCSALLERGLSAEVQ